MTIVPRQIYSLIISVSIEINDLLSPPPATLEVPLTVSHDTRKFTIDA